jgi:hypothetical protein
MMEAARKLTPLLSRRQGGDSWRNNPAIFASETEGFEGAVNLSPGWMQQGHEVICFTVEFRHR